MKLHNNKMFAGISLSVLLAAAAHAQAPAGAPAGTTGLCNDGTYYSGATKKGACRGHQGVKDWYAGATTPAASPAPSPAPAPAPASSPAPAAAAASAAAPAGAPAGSTGLCNDGTYYSGATKKGACRGHQGVKDWYGAAATATAAGAAATVAKTNTVAAPTPAPAPAQSTASTPPAKSTAPTQATPAPGGGPGMVWVNTSSKVYHCQGDRYYGNTKQGQYMTQAQAKSEGARAAYGKECP